MPNRTPIARRASGEGNELTRMDRVAEDLGFLMARYWFKLRRVEPDAPPKQALAHSVGRLVTSFDEEGSRQRSTDHPPTE